jgi:hypothetical protein
LYLNIIRSFAFFWRISFFTELNYSCSRRLNFWNTRLPLSCAWQ